MALEMSSAARILVVDDDPRLRHILSLYLQVQRLEVVTAANGQEGLDALSAGLPDLIITDVMMPVMDGITFCRRVRALPGAASLPIIVFTSLDLESDLEMAQTAGADRVITKPFSLTGLGETVQALLPQATAA
ncbi:MAG: response regulator [Candidatus Dormibacteraeota bacterium]|nr:response regulator [Candidatus Dormibacteraeota bacterium]